MCAFRSHNVLVKSRISNLTSASSRSLNKARSSASPSIIPHTQFIRIQLSILHAVTNPASLQSEEHVTGVNKPSKVVFTYFHVLGPMLVIELTIMLRCFFLFLQPFHGAKTKTVQETARKLCLFLQRSHRNEA